MPCAHPNTEVTKDKAVGGGLRYLEQCVKCGKRLKRLNPEAVPDPGSLPWFDRRLAHRARPGKRKRIYQQRLKAHSWKRLRRIVLDRDNWTCRFCEEPANTVAHLTYERLGDERLDDLAASCERCQRLEREQRITSHVMGTGT